jgi:ATP-dependent protease Clp ATPase subunit
MKLLVKKKHVDCYCDFCGKCDSEVEKMINGKFAFICDRCVEAASKLTKPCVGDQPAR